MKFLLPFLLFTLSYAETAVDTFDEGNISKIKSLIKDNREVETAEQKRQRILTKQPEKAIDNIAIEVIDYKANDKTSIGVEYTPTLKKGTIIDNKEQTSIKLKYKF